MGRACRVVPKRVAEEMTLHEHPKQKDASEVCPQMPLPFQAHPEEHGEWFAELKIIYIRPSRYLVMGLGIRTCERATAFWCNSLVAQGQPAMLMQDGSNGQRIGKQFTSVSSRPLGVHGRETTSIPKDIPISK